MSQPTPETAPEDSARALPCWRGRPEIVPLEGGITNTNLLVTDAGRRFVVRLGHDIPEHGIMRFNELAISRAAHAAGLSPGIHHAEPGVLVLDYIDASPLSEAQCRAPVNLKRIADLLARVHRDVAGHLRGPTLTFWVFQVIRDYAATLKRLSSPHRGDLPDLLSRAVALESVVGPIDLVLGHNDMLPANLLDDGERLWLIDWEYGGWGSALFDLAGVATNNAMDAGDETSLLTRYFGAEPDPHLRRRFAAMKCASLLRETLWSMVSEATSHLDFDYAAYTAANRARFERAHEDFVSGK